MLFVLNMTEYVTVGRRSLRTLESAASMHRSIPDDSPNNSEAHEGRVYPAWSRAPQLRIPSGECPLILLRRPVSFVTTLVPVVTTSRDCRNGAVVLRDCLSDESSELLEVLT